MERGHAWYNVELDEVKGWIKESDVIKVSPYDWQVCDFVTVKENENDGWTLTSDDINDSQIEYDKLPQFFKEIFDQIDVDHNKIIDCHELMSAMQIEISLTNYQD